MGVQVCMGASLQCTFGAAPSTMVVTPENQVVGDVPLATIMDFVPMKNIMPFGSCNSTSNPVVAAATAAALGVFTPMPCIPCTSSPWIVGAPTVLIKAFPTLDNNSKLMCMWGGVIQVVAPGQFKVMTP